MKTSTQAAAAKVSVDVQGWQERFEEFTTWLGERVLRAEPRRRLGKLLAGMMTGLPRVNCWTIAEHAGEADPRGMQRFLASAVVDTDGLADDLRGYVIEHLGDPLGVLIVDETGDVKQGTATVGVAPQYTGTAGRVINCQVAVYLAYATRRGYAFLDRALYLPARWTDDRDRCAAAGVPADVRFATKPALATALIERAVRVKVPCAWVAGDEVYGNDPQLRAAVAAAGLAFVFAVACNHQVNTAIGPRKVVELATRPDLVWNRLPAGHGVKGPRLFDWALIDVPDPAVTDPTGYAGVLIRKALTDGDLTFYRVYSPKSVPLQAFAQVAGTRWRIEEAFASGKELTGLDEHQVRCWTSWHRWTLLAMLAHAFLTVTALSARAEPDHDALVPITRNEIRHLLIRALATPLTWAFTLAWSHWRRTHQPRQNARTGAGPP